jgi:hypothetical protein
MPSLSCFTAALLNISSRSSTSSELSSRDSVVVTAATELGVLQGSLAVESCASPALARYFVQWGTLLRHHSNSVECKVSHYREFDGGL